MENSQKMLAIINKQGIVTAKELGEAFGVSRQYINQVLQGLLLERKIVKTGSTRSARYVSLAYAAEHPNVLDTTFRARYVNEKLEEHKVLQTVEERFYQLGMLPENVRSIFTFAFSEMLNNAIEHSGSASIVVMVTIEGGTLTFTIEDSGVGVFRNIMQKRKLDSPVEAIQDLLKGKTTTMPKSHSGEGIFFTSRAADGFTLDSFGSQLVVTNTLPDIREAQKIKRGTRVTFTIATSSRRHLNDVFKKYANLVDGGSYGFDKTEIRVKLYATAGVHISRSQARRILSGLEKFQIILLDYDQVPIVGQAFVDEIYRVFKNVHPAIQIKEENMSEGVRFMVERAKNEARRAA